MIKKIFLSSGFVLGLLSCSQPPERLLDGKTPNDKDLTPGTSDGTQNSGTVDPIKTPVDDGTTPSTPIPMEEPEPVDPMEEPEPMKDPDPIEITDPGTKGDGDFVIGPYYTDSADVKDRGGAKGTLREFSMKSKDSKIYKGQDEYLKFKGDFTRKGWLYTPAGYKGDKALPFIFVGDGSWGQHQNDLINSLNNLIAAKKIPPMAAVLLSPGVINGKGDGPGSQRSFEYDSVTGVFGDFVETEVLPKLTKDFGVKFVDNPEGRATMGGSSSGAMAFTMAWFKPDRYRRVLTYSGTFVNRIQTTEHAKGAWEYHQKLIPQAEKKPLRVFIHVSDGDNNFKPDVTNNWIEANRNMAKVFKEKGYHYRFQFSEKTGHIDGKVYRQTLPENLIWLWRGYPIPK